VPLFLVGLRMRDLVDIAIVAFVIYRVLLVFRGTVAIQMLAGLGLLMVARFVSRQADLRSLSFVLENFWAFWVLALIVLFQPELRRTLAQAGRSRLLRRLLGAGSAARLHVSEEVARAVEALAHKRIGALIAIERSVGLRAYAELGVTLEAIVSAELLGSVFQPGSPLHDGAVVIQGDRITAGGSFLPLSRNLGLSRTFGTRHRAAMGLSEETDAAVVVVSEETGVISLAVEGTIERGLDAERLQARLAALLDGTGRGRTRARAARSWPRFAGSRRGARRDRRPGLARRALAAQGGRPRVRGGALDLRRDGGPRRGGVHRPDRLHRSADERRGDLARRRDGDRAGGGPAEPPAAAHRGRFPGAGEPQERPAGTVHRPAGGGQRLGPPGRAHRPRHAGRDPGDPERALANVTRAARLFGTDGIRGIANADPLTPELVCRLGRLSARLLAERAPAGVKRPARLVGRDTRLSGPLLEQALGAGILSTGVDALLAGVLPTPAVAALTPALGAAGGVVLSASHNPFEDNGIKLFSAEGDKLPDAWEDEIEASLRSGVEGPRPTGAGLGRVRPVPGAAGRYLDEVRRVLPAGFALAGRRLVLDCAHGATCRVAPRLFRSLGAEVTTVGTRPSGTNIHRRVGALHPEGLRDRIRAAPGAIGLAFDGDGDRLIVVDETGVVRDGDHVLAVCAGALQARGALRGDVVVSTVMANLGLERALSALGLSMVRTAVGDRYVLAEMRRLGANLGGEQSGHVIFLDHARTGDGLLTALELLRAVGEAGRPFAELASAVTKCPQVLVNVRVRATPPLDGLPAVGEAMARWQATLDGRARFVVRYSGTEPLARVMVEGDDQEAIDTAAREIAAAIHEEIGAIS
jgi:phosphoglucosamine mutase